MAVSWKVECKRGGDLHSFLPEDLVVKPEFAARHDPLSEEDFEALVASINLNGQLEPIIIRKEAGMPVVIAGYNRRLAIGEINRRKLKPEPMRVNCVYRDCNEIEAYALAWEENHKRAATTPLDDAYHFDTFRKFWNLTESQIADKVRVTPAFVKSRLALISVEPEVQAAVADGRVPITQAKRIKDLTAQQQRELVKKNGKAKITAKDVDVATGKVSKPSYKALRQYIEQFDGPGVEDETRETVRKILAFMDGGVK